VQDAGEGLWDLVPSAAEGTEGIILRVRPA
jgi:hypothetical protein